MNYTYGDYLLGQKDVSVWKLSESPVTDLVLNFDSTLWEGERLDITITVQSLRVFDES